MSLLDDIKKMQAEGKSDDDIADELRSKNIPEPKINDALSQLRIRSAVVNPSQLPAATQEIDAEASQEYVQQVNQEEQQYPQQNEQQPEQVYAEAPQGYAPQQAQQGYQEQYQYSQQPQPQQMSSDIMTEIAEQVVSEKLSSIRDRLEKTIDMKTTFDAKLSSIDERLKRIEQIIDRLQLSILQRVGAYMSEVDNVKKELVETQKSFKTASQPKPQRPQQNQPQRYSTQE